MPRSNSSQNPDNSPTRSLGPSETLPGRHLGVQIVEDALLGDLARVLHLKLLLQLEPRLLLRDGQDGALHKWVHHPGLDGLVGRGRGARVEEEDGALLGAVVRVLEAEEGEPRLGGGNGLDKLCDVARGR